MSNDSDQFLPPVDDDEELGPLDRGRRRAGADEGESYTATGMSDLLMKGEAVEEWYGRSSDPRRPSGELDIDYEAMPERMRQSRSGTGAAEPARKRTEKGAPGEQTAAGYKGTRERGVLEPIEVKRPRRGAFIAGVAFLAIAGGFLGLRMYQAGAEGRSLKASFEAVAADRQQVYALLSEAMAEGRPEQNHCLHMDGLEEDTTFYFQDEGIAGFPVLTRLQQERAVLDNFDAGNIGVELLQESVATLQNIGELVIHVHVHSWRLPTAEQSNPTRDGPLQVSVPGYLIGDAYLASSASGGQLLCSFRFFASSSPTVPREGATADLLRRTYAALEAGIRDRNAEPGRSGGRYRSTRPPPGF